MRDEVKNELDIEFERVFRKDLKDEDLDDLEEDTILQRKMMEEFSLEFSVMNDGEKLKTLATKTLDLYRKAK